MEGGTDTSMPDASDPNPYGVRFIVPAGNVGANAQPVLFQAVVDEVVDRVDFVLDGSVIANLAPPYQWTLPTANLTVGPHTVIPRAVVGTETYDGPAITLTIDRTAPAAIDENAITTGDPRGLLPERTPVYVTFGEPLHPSTTSTLVLTPTAHFSATPVAGAVTVEGNRVVFTPDRPWFGGASVNFAVSGHVLDAAGNQRNVSISKSFTVLTGWSAPRVLGRHVSTTVHGNGNHLFATVYGYNDTLQGGELRLFGEVGGVTVTPPALDAGYTHVRRLDSGLALDGTAYVLFTEIIALQGVRAVVVARRDAGTGVWTKQTLVASDDPTYVNDLSLVVAPNGHAFIRLEGGTMLHRAPTASTFTPTTAFDDLYISDTSFFVGATPRVCFLMSSLVAPSDTEMDVRFLCHGGGAPDGNVPVARVPASTEQELFHNAGGQALLRLGTQLYRFDGNTETLAAPVTIPSYSPVMKVGFGPTGHVCVAGLGHSPEEHVRVLKMAPLDTAFAAGVRATPYTELGLYLQSVAVDAVGHCFVEVGDGVLHDATTDGHWADRFFPLYGVARVLAGGASRAFVFQDSEPSELFSLTPL